MLLMMDYFVFNYVDVAMLNILISDLKSCKMDYLSITNDVDVFSVDSCLRRERNFSIFKISKSLKNYNYSIISADFF